MVPKFHIRCEHERKGAAIVYITSCNRGIDIGRSGQLLIQFFQNNNSIKKNGLNSKKNTLFMKEMSNSYW